MLFTNLLIIMLKYTVGVLMTQTCGGTSICLNDLLHPLAKHVKKHVRFLGSLSWIMNGKVLKEHINEHTVCSMCAGGKTAPHSDSIQGTVVELI